MVAELDLDRLFEPVAAVVDRKVDLLALADDVEGIADGMRQVAGNLAGYKHLAATVGGLRVEADRTARSIVRVNGKVVEDNELLERVC